MGVIPHVAQSMIDERCDILSAPRSEQDVFNGTVIERSDGLPAIVEFRFDIVLDNGEVVEPCDHRSDLLLDTDHGAGVEAADAEGVFPLLEQGLYSSAMVVEVDAVSALESVARKQGGADDHGFRALMLPRRTPAKVLAHWAQGQRPSLAQMSGDHHAVGSSGEVRRLPRARIRISGRSCA